MQRSVSHPIAADGQGLSGVQVLSPVKHWLLHGEVFAVILYQGLHDLAVDPPGTLVWDNGHVIVVEDAVGDLDLTREEGEGGRGGREGGRRGREEREGGREGERMEGSKSMV